MKKKATKKRVVKKRRTAAQKAATKKLVALNKKRTTKKKTTARKKKPVRRRNPARSRRSIKHHVLCVVPSVAGVKKGLDPKQTGYWTGTGWDTKKTKAVKYPSLAAVKNEAMHLPKKYRSGIYWSYAHEAA